MTHVRVERVLIAGHQPRNTAVIAVEHTGDPAGGAAAVIAAVTVHWWSAMATLNINVATRPHATLGACHQWQRTARCGVARCGYEPEEVNAKVRHRAHNKGQRVGHSTPESLHEMPSRLDLRLFLTVGLPQV